MHAQNPQPWWITNPSVDSTEFKQLVLADSILNYAYSFMGIPYVWGGSHPTTGFDCSGFVCYVFNKYGIDLPRTSAVQFDAGIPVNIEDARRGDLILFTGTETDGFNPGHVGIIMATDNNGFTFLHTSSPTSGGVHVSHSSESYFYKRLLEIRRVIGANE